MGYIFGHFSTFSIFGQNEFSFLFYISFSFQKCHLRWAENVMFATEPKTKFCDIGTGDFRFRFFGRERHFILVGIFVYDRKWKKYIFVRPLHQTVSDYTLRQWFSNSQQSRFRTVFSDLERRDARGPIFYPRDALHSAVFAVELCPSVRLSVTRLYCV